MKKLKLKLHEFKAEAIQIFKPRHSSYPSDMKNLFSNLKLPFLLILTIVIQLETISCHTIVSSEHKCSHIPITKETNKRILLKDFHQDKQYDRTTYFERSDNYMNLQDEDIRQRRDLVVFEKNKRKPDWRFYKNTHSNDATHDIYNSKDLIPLKIKEHYDESVYELPETKFKTISKIVIPEVVRFFEDALFIRRDQALTTFKMSRVCPNNTVYYLRDMFGTTRGYCMNRCKDYAFCGEIMVPESHLDSCFYCNSTSRRCSTDSTKAGRGVEDAQLLLYVSAKQTNRCRKDQTIAYAAHCAQDYRTDRPIAGHANLCPSSIGTVGKDLRALISTVKHELTHVLGFSVSLFAYYRNEHGQPLTERDFTMGPLSVDPISGYAKWSDKIIKKVKRKNWVTGAGLVDKEIQIIVTPTVVREVRKHFNCSTLEGAELEDQGSDGTSLTHWEKRLFENEAMTGTHTQNSVYSPLTLAILQDTGWYVANFSKASKLNWGRNLGCDFATKSCKSWIDERRKLNLSISPFCDRVKDDFLQISCTDDRTSKAVCNMKLYNESLPKIYSNFDRLSGVSQANLSRYGGSVDLADYCPFIQEFTWQAPDVPVRGSRCDSGENSIDYERNAALEYYGPEARCFEHAFQWEQRSCSFKRHWYHFGAGCYKFLCTNGRIDVLVANKTYSCYYEKQVLNIEIVVDKWLYNGTIICPNCNELCNTGNADYFSAAIGKRDSNLCTNYNKYLIDKLMSVNVDKLLQATTNESSNNIVDSYSTERKTKIVASSSSSSNTMASSQRLLLLLSALNVTRASSDLSAEFAAFDNELLDSIVKQKHQNQKLVCSSTETRFKVMQFEFVAVFSLMLLLFIIKKS